MSGAESPVSFVVLSIAPPFHGMFPCLVHLCLFIVAVVIVVVVVVVVDFVVVVAVVAVVGYFDLDTLAFSCFASAATPARR